MSSLPWIKSLIKVGWYFEEIIKNFNISIFNKSIFILGLPKIFIIFCLINLNKLIFVFNSDEVISSKAKYLLILIPVSLIIYIILTKLFKAEVLTFKCVSSFKSIIKKYKSLGNSSSKLIICFLSINNCSFFSTSYKE